MYYTFWMLYQAKTRENIQVCVNVLPTSYRQVTNTLPTVGRQVAYISGKTCWLTDDQQSADCRPTVRRQVFWGALLHNYRHAEYNN